MMHRARSAQTNLVKPGTREKTPQKNKNRANRKNPNKVSTIFCLNVLKGFPKKSVFCKTELSKMMFHFFGALNFFFRHRSPLSDTVNDAFS